MSKERGELTVRVAFEPDENFPLKKMRDWLIAKFKEAPKYSNQGVITIAVYDEEGNLVGSDTIGKVDETKQKELEGVLGLNEVA